MESIKKIAIFGATGMTGLCVVHEALSLGLHVKALLRENAVLPDDTLEKIEIVRGDVTDADAVAKTVAGTDGVIVALGTRNKLEATTVMSTGVQNIIAAMHQIGIKPISVCLSSFLLMPEDAVPQIFHEINKEHGRMLEAVQRSSADWIAVLPPHIADTPRGEYFIDEGVLPGGRMVSKRDLAAFLIDSLSHPEYYHKQIGIASIQSWA